MAFTKINAAGIGTTETVTVDGLTVINNGSFGGNLTVSGVLTYEDVTNVDSVGLITARNGIVVGSGITLSKDGDIFATGITTVSGNVKVGTGITLSPDGDGFYTGVVTATSFSGSGANLTGIDTDLVSDTTPQLGGDLDTNDNAIRCSDSNGTNNQITFGDSNDLQIRHQSNSSYIINSTGNLNIGSNNEVRIKGGSDVAEMMIKCVDNGTVELYHDGTKKFETISTGVVITGSDDGDGGAKGDFKFFQTDGTLKIMFDASTSQFEFLDNSKASFGNDDDLKIYHDSNNSAINHNGTGDLYIQSNNNIYIRNIGGDNYISAIEDGAVELYYNNTKRIETNNTGAFVTGELGCDTLYMGDNEKVKIGNGDDIQIFHDGTENFIEIGQNLIIKQGGENIARFHPNADVELYYDSSKKFETHTNGVQVHNGGIDLNRQAAAHSGAIYFAGFGDTNHVLWQDFYDNPNGTRGTGSGFDGIKWNVYAGIHFYKGNEGETLASFLADSSCKLYFNNGNRLETASGGAICYGTLTETSDIALKTDIQPLTNVLDKIKQISGYKYQFKETGHDAMGVTAQDVEKVFPEIVQGSEGEKTLAYSGLVGALVEAVKELSTKNDALETRIKTLEE